jgi:hypothetical protein
MLTKRSPRVVCWALRAAVGLILLTGGCADSADTRAQFVSPELYQELTCEQLGNAGDHVAGYAAAIAGTTHERPSSTTILGNRVVLVHWPTTLPDTDDAGQLDRLRGEFEALSKAASQRRCRLAFQQRNQPSE